MHLVALGERNTVLVRKKFSRAQLVVYTANLASLLIGLEACAGAHFMGRCCEDKGTKCGSSLAQFIKPYRKSNKNDSSMRKLSPKP
jgi:transposase